MTSNLGSAYINESEDDDMSDATRQLVMGSIKAAMPTEFVNRIDSIVVFSKLSRKNVKSIVDVRLREVEGRIAANGGKSKLVLDDEAKDFLVATGFSPTMGARPLNRSIQQELLSPLSILILSGRVNIKEDPEIHVKFDRHRNGLVVLANHEGTAGTEGVEDEDMSDEESDDFAKIEEDPLD